MSLKHWLTRKLITTYTIIFIAFVTILGFMPSPIAATTLGPVRDYMVETDDGQHVIVMLTQDDEEYKAFWFRPRFERDEKIRDIYQMSGLYKKDGSTTPIWTVNWYSPVICPSQNGQQLARFGYTPIGDYRSLAIAFYHQGQEIKRYLVNDLVRDPWTLPHVQGWYDKIECRGNANRLKVFTWNNEMFKFDTITGELVEQELGRLESSIQLIIFGEIIAFAFIAYAFWASTR